MTIDEAKYELDYCIRDMIEQKSHNDDKALDIAVKSLEAWGEIKQEIMEYCKKGVMDGDIISTELCAIINKHLQEVEK